MKGIFALVALACLFHSACAQWQLTSPMLRPITPAAIASDSLGNILLVQLYNERVVGSWSFNNGSSWVPANFPYVTNYYYGASAYAINNTFYVSTGSYYDSAFFVAPAAGANFTLNYTNFEGMTAPQAITLDNGQTLYGGVSYYQSNGFQVSNNGVNYTSSPLPFYENYYGFQAVGDWFIIVSSNPYPTIASQDGVHWVNWTTSVLFGDYYSLTYFTGANNQVVAAANYYNDNTQFFVLNEKTNSWTQISANITGMVYAYTRTITYGNGVYYAIIEDYSNWQSPFTIQYSSDLVNWHNTNSPPFSPYIPQIFAVNNVVFAWFSNGSYIQSTQLTSWATPSTGFYGYWSEIFVVSGGFVLQTSTNMFYRTTDGINFVALPKAPFPTNVFTSDRLLESWQVDGVFYFLESNGTVFSTPDFQTWTETVLGVADSFYTPAVIQQGNGVWVGIVDVFNVADDLYYALVMSASDPTGEWTTSLKSNGYASSSFYSLTFGNGIFVLQLEGVIYTSKDGNTWVAVPNFATQAYATVDFVGTLFFLSTSPGYYYISPNATAWDVVPTWNYGNPQYDPNSQTYYAFYMYYGYVTLSKDGRTWTTNPTLSFSNGGSGTYLESLAFNGTQWIAADNTGEVFVFYGSW